MDLRMVDKVNKITVLIVVMCIISIMSLIIFYPKNADTKNLKIYQENKNKENIVNVYEEKQSEVESVIKDHEIEISNNKDQEENTKSESNKSNIIINQTKTEDKVIQKTEEKSKQETPVNAQEKTEEVKEDTKVEEKEETKEEVKEEQKEETKEETPVVEEKYVINNAMISKLKDAINNNVSDTMKEFGYEIVVDKSIIPNTNQFTFTEYRVKNKIKNKFGQIRIYAQDYYYNGELLYTECYLM